MSMPVSVFYKVCFGNFVYLIWFNGPWLQRPIDTTYKSAKSPGVRSNEVRLYHLVKDLQLHEEQFQRYFSQEIPWNPIRL